MLLFVEVGKGVIGLLESSFHFGHCLQSASIGCPLLHGVDLPKLSLCLHGSGFARGDEPLLYGIEVTNSVVVWVLFGKSHDVIRGLDRVESIASNLLLDGKVAESSGCRGFGGFLGVQ